MKLLRVAMLSVFLVLLSAAAYAGSIPIDPKIKIGAPPDPPDPAITSTSFGITSPTGTSGPFTNNDCILDGTSETGCTFDNLITGPDESGQTIYSLSFVMEGIDPSTVTCGILEYVAFADCSVGSNPGGGTLVKFFNGSVPYENEFWFDVEGFPAGTDFDGTASTSATPEPGTMALFLSGLGVFLVHRKVRSR